MENSIDYINHVNIVKDLNLYTTVRENQKPYEERFEEVYQKAKDADVTLDTAKDFLNTLSKTEQIALKRFNSLADMFNVDSLSNEGAYNLFVHSYEKYDWNEDGVTETATAKNLMNIPQDMDDTTKKAWVKTLNSMGDDISAIGIVTMSLNDEYNKRQIAQHLSKMSESEIAKMQEGATFDINQFMQDTLSKEYAPEIITILDILDKIDNIINPSNAGYSSPEIIESAQHLKEEFLKAYGEVELELENGKLGTHQAFEIKQDVIDKENEEKEEPLAVAIETTKNSELTTEEIIEKYRAMPGQGGILDIDAYKQDLALKFAKHEPYFQAQYEHYEKYQDIFTPMYSNYTTEKANAIGRDLHAQFPDFRDIKHKAYYGGTEENMKVFENMLFDYQAYNKYLREKHNLDMDGGAYSKEATKAYNFAVYEGLESGLSIGEATDKANAVASMFGGNEANAFSMMLFNGLPEDIEAETKITEEEIDYDKQINLSDYGFEHNFWSDAYTDTYGKDATGVKSRIMYDIKLYSFLLENETIVDKKLGELQERAYETENGKDWYDWRNEDGKFNEEFKSSFESKYDNAIYAKEIYDKYSTKIFDNTLIDSMDSLVEKSATTKEEV
ncbi:MAG: hypothetical protein ACI9TV_002384 [Sulfurimonas sp.]|jgi:hypothetical protein|uniref:hypothetical protein n=1 Tax=Sulfurimonas sp. TaxID=2022749 RepID=UPI0039E3D450